MKINMLKRLVLLALLVSAINIRLSAQTKSSNDTGQIVKLEKFNMPQLNRQRTIRIFLPKGYSTSGKSYPVVYMTDGQNIYKNDAAIKSTWGVDSTLNAQSANKQCIIVGVDHAGKDRISEYNPYDSKYGKGDGMTFTRFLVETLKPYIDEHYRTKKDAKHTAIAGSSLGSLLAMYAADKYPETFGIAGIFSPAFWIGPQIYTLTATEPAIKKVRYYLTCGDKESSGELADVNKMDSVLVTRGFSLKQVPPVKVNVGSQHNELQWRQAFPAFYRWLVERF
jgi:predicted alpha/beta superfamily hydrolase